MNRFVLQILVLILSVSVLQAQDSRPSLRSLLNQAEKSKATGNYYDALHKYLEAIEIEPENVAYKYQAADVARLYRAYSVAKNLYTEVLADSTNVEYPLTALWLGQVNHFLGDYSAARENYQIYLSEHSGEDNFYTALVEKELKACSEAVELVQNPVKGTKIALFEGINSDFTEFAPALKGDDFYYTSMRFPNKVDRSLPVRRVAKILREKDGRYQPMDNMSVNIPGKSVAHTSFHPNGEIVYFSVCDNIDENQLNCVIHAADITDQEEWINIRPLASPINMEQSYNGMPNISAHSADNYATLYFVSNREGGKGGYDIWYSTIDQNGNFSEPQNLEYINTVYDEVTPYFHSRSDVLYFSSTGYHGLGGYDIYRAVETENGWLVKNAGTPLNTPQDELWFVLLEDTRNGYMASNRDGSQYIDPSTEACCLDIYEVRLAPCEIDLQSLVFDAMTKEALHGAEIVLIDLTQKKKRRDSIFMLDTHEAHFEILCDREYALLARMPGYEPAKIKFYSGKPGEFEKITKKLYLKPKGVYLEVLTFDKQTGNPLNGATVTIIDLDDPDWGSLYSNRDDE